VDLEEDFEELPEADAQGVENDLHCFGVAIMMGIGSVLDGASGVPHSGRNDTILAT
jgi:hypothetical protein